MGKFLRRLSGETKLGCLLVMKKEIKVFFTVFFTAVLLLVVFFLFFAYSYGNAYRRVRFIDTMNSLKEAHIEAEQYGAFTNYFKNINIYSYTNSYVIKGTNYQCEFAAERAEFGNQGFLAITTNQVFVWIDKKRGVIPLIVRKTTPFPPGF